MKPFRSYSRLQHKNNLVSTLSERFTVFSFQMKTVSVALVLCLNVGVDPPDVVKTTPCARLECWIGES